MQLLRVQAQRAADKLAASESLLAAARLELQLKEEALSAAQTQVQPASQGGQPTGPTSAVVAASGSAGGGGAGSGNPLLGLPRGVGHAQAGAWFEEYVLQDPRWAVLPMYCSGSWCDSGMMDGNCSCWTAACIALRRVPASAPS